MITDTEKRLDTKGSIKQLVRPIPVERNLFYIVQDAELGRREIAPGIGEVKVCVGHYIERDQVTGKNKYVPAYRTKKF